MAKQLSPQYWDTNCLVCGKRQFAATENVICNECENTSAAADYVAKLKKAAEKMRKALVEIDETLSGDFPVTRLVKEIAKEALK